MAMLLLQKNLFAVRLQISQILKLVVLITLLSSEIQLFKLYIYNTYFYISY